MGIMTVGVFFFGFLIGALAELVQVICPRPHMADGSTYACLGVEPMSSAHCKRSACCCHQATHLKERCQR